MTRSNAPTLVLMVRHGRTPTTGKVLPGRAPGLHLSDEGQAEAERVAERIGAIAKVDAVYASPLERARETAAPIGRALGEKVLIHKGLLECDFGAWTGASLTSLIRQVRLAQGFLVFLPHPTAR
jgi:probable phosphoglycerate mutase